MSDLLQLVVSEGASDLHIRVGTPPTIRVHGILQRAGFTDIEIIAHDDLVGSGDVDAMLAVCLRVGALGRILQERPELRATTLPAVRSALAAHDGPDGVRLNAATWVVTARAPARLG